ncbi:hypothetical protein [Streptomyces sp. Amel2xC10]|uniref:hypothetical protein n=1 Tax=Streptomyces sp. Amel2xC10 TaxID=1305826 RepID=UPI000A154291|nr:hypothetical protein [Streptomyces sp. Amel2xC10]
MKRIPCQDCPAITPAERRRLILGDEVIARIRARVAEAPDPSPELVEQLRRILTNPGGTVPKAGPAVCCEGPDSE